VIIDFSLLSPTDRRLRYRRDATVQSVSAVKALILPALPHFKQSRQLPNAPSVDEFHRLLAATGWIEIAIALSGYAGLRQGEVSAPQIRDLDFKSSRIMVRHAFSELVTPKSTHERDVPMAPKDALNSLKAVQRRARLPTRSFHQLRHFSCSRLLQVGGSIEVVRMLATAI
jgi:integrase